MELIRSSMRSLLGRVDNDEQGSPFDVRTVGVRGPFGSRKSVVGGRNVFLGFVSGPMDDTRQAYLGGGSK